MDQILDKSPRNYSGTGWVNNRMTGRWFTATRYAGEPKINHISKKSHIREVSINDHTKRIYRRYKK